MTSLAQFFDQWRQKHAYEREIQTVDPTEIEAIGLSRVEFLRIARMPAEQVARMEKMMRLHGADPKKMFAEWAHLEAAKTCSTCTAQGACIREMTAGHTTPERTAFCANSAYFADHSAGNQAV